VSYSVAYVAQHFKALLGVEKLKDSKFKGVACAACKVATEPARVLDNKAVMTGIEWLLKEICIELHIMDADSSVCQGVIDRMASFILPALVKGPLSAQYICDENLGLCDDPVIAELDVNEYVN